jgi:hypothetical protein
VSVVLTAYQTTNLEDADPDEEYKLEVEVLVGFAPGRLRRSNSQEEGAAVPANILKAAELGLQTKTSCQQGVPESTRVVTLFTYRDRRYSCRDDCLLLSLSAASGVVRYVDRTMSREHCRTMDVSKLNQRR